MGSLREARSLEDLAQLLQIDGVDKKLLLALSLNGDRNGYSTWHIAKKKKGEFRRISSPKPVLKSVQRELNKSLVQLHEPSPNSHGFLRGKSIVTNAQSHVGRRWVFNLDLEDFFPTIKAHRIQGMLNKPPYSLDKNIAEIITRLCTHQGRLPAGAPTSPTISNMICRGLDRKLEQLARENNCSYTRYADDLTFSSSMLVFPAAIAVRDGVNWGVGPTLLRTISRAGFKINESKVRMQEKATQQSVTGLVVNARLNVNRSYIRNIRGAFHAWAKYGYESANAEFNQRLRVGTTGIDLYDVLEGRISFISMVRGKGDPLVVRLWSDLKDLDQRRKFPPEPTPGEPEIPGTDSVVGFNVV